MELNLNRINIVGNTLKEFGINNVLIIEENLDPQFDYIQKLKQNVGKNYATIYALLTALISYKLAMKGEEWWKCFSEFLSNKGTPRNLDEAIKNVNEFIISCKGSIIGQRVKLKRIEKVTTGTKDMLEKIVENPDIVIEKPNYIMSSIAKSLNTEEWKKTITFSIKMAYYAIKNKGEIRILRLNIPMPIDVRISCISYTSGIVLSDSYLDILKKPKVAIEAWNKVSEISGIPQIHLDSLLWVIGWAPRDLGIAEAKEQTILTLSKYFNKDKVEKLIEELFYKECK